MVFPDALGWHDVWMSLTHAARRTTRIRLGPAVTNPYTRHPYVTAAAYATFHEISDGRSLLGVGAGGAELDMYAGIDRTDSPQRVRELVSILRSSSAGHPPLPMASPVPHTPLLGAARKPKMTAAVAETCDAVLISGQARPDMERTADIVKSRSTAVCWSPMLAIEGDHLRAGIVYGLLNSPPETKAAVGVDAELEQQIREDLSKGGTSHAAAIVPDAAVAEFTFDGTTHEAETFAVALGASSIAVQAFDINSLPDRVAWARTVVEGILEPASLSRNSNMGEDS